MKTVFMHSTSWLYRGENVEGRFICVFHKVQCLPQEQLKNTGKNVVKRYQF